MTVQSPARAVESITMDILHEVAAVRDVDPIDLSPPLGSVIDPDALDTLVGQESDTSVAVEFTYAGCHVSVANNEIVVQPQVDLE